MKGLRLLSVSRRPCQISLAMDIFTDGATQGFAMAAEPKREMQLLTFTFRWQAAVASERVII
jgi:hypothetical protein